MTQETENTPAATVDAADVIAAEYPSQPIERLIGQREPRFQAIIRQSVLDDIHAHGKSSMDAEICGVLVGNVFSDDKGAYLLIDASIR